MKTRINLFTDDLLPQSGGFTAARAILFVLLGCLPAILWPALLHWHSANVNSQLSALDQQLLSQSEQLQALTQKGQQQPSLEQQLATLQQQFERKQALLAQVSQSNTSQVQLSGLMTALADAAEGDVWLTEILYAAPQLTLQGGTTNAAAMPKWLQRLQQQPQWRGQDFSHISMRESEQGGYLQFVLSSEIQAQHSSESSEEVPNG